MCNRSTERIDLNVIREAPPTVDLDHRQPLPIGSLEGGIAADVDLLEHESELLPQRAHLAERAVAEVAALGVVDDNASGYGYSPRVTVASATRPTATP